MSHNNQTAMNWPRRRPINVLFLALAFLAGLISLASGKPQGAAANGIQIRGPEGAQGMSQVDTTVTTGAISGRVTAESDGIPLGRIIVQASYSDGWDFAGYAVTDAYGDYTIADLDPGNYQVRFIDNQMHIYASEYYDNTPTIEHSDPVTVSAGKVTTGIDAALTKVGGISGRVTAESDGTPLAGISVFAEYYTGTSWAGGRSATTDDNGKYRLSGLWPENYRVSFFSDGEYAEEFYDGVPDEGSATAVLVSPGALTTGINATLVRPGKISGRVTDELDGTPLYRITVEARYEMAAGWSDVRSDLTDGNGYYTIYSLPPGKYQVRFRDGLNNVYAQEFYDNVSDEQSAADVPVNAGGTTAGIDAALRKYEAGHITGSVTAEKDGSPLPQITVLAYKENFDLAASVKTDSSGEYALTLLPGTYRLEFKDESSWYIHEYYDDVQTNKYAATPIEVAESQTVSGIDAALAASGRISGRVTAEKDGTQLPTIQVRAYRHNGSGWDYFAKASTNIHGLYTLFNLPDGTYRLWFLDTNYVYIYEYYADAPDIHTAADINVTGLSTITDVDAALAKNGFISGRITAEAGGQPLSNIRACAWRYEETRWDFTGSCKYTDANGDYKITGLTPDIYRVGFNDFSKVYADEFYDNVFSVEDGTDVPFHWHTVTGINAALAENGHITGRVTAEDSGLPLENIGVRSYIYSGSTWQNVSYAVTDANGDYVLGAMVTGSYRVGFEDTTGGYAGEYYDNAPNLDSAADVAVTLSETTPGIDAELSPMRYGQISGKITNEDGQPLENIRVNVFYDNGIVWSITRTTYTNAKGSYTISLPVGSYRIGFNDTSLYGRIIEYYDDAPTIESAADIPVTDGNTTSGIDAALMYPAPANDDFDEAIDISTLPFSDNKFVVYAATAADDPIIPCGSAETPRGYASMWYAFTPPQTGLLTANTAGSSYDTVLVVWAGTRGNLTAVACNDDVHDYDFHSFIFDLPLSAGTTYYLEIVGATYDDEFAIEDLDLNVDFALDKPGSITIAKQANPAGTAIFTFDGAFGEFTLQDGEGKVFNNLAAGDYLVRELDQSGWSLGQIDCTSANVTEESDRVTIHLAVGKKVTCTFINDRLSVTADAGGPYSGNEGSPLPLDASASTNKEIIKVYKWDCTSDGTFDISSNSPTGSSCIYDDNGVFTVTLKTVDIFDQHTRDTSQVTVKNISPVVDAGKNQTAAVGTEVQFAGTVYDPGAADTHAIHWEFGDGRKATNTLTPAHVYNHTGEYTVILTVTDDDGGLGQDTLHVTVLQDVEFMTLLPLITRQ